MCAGNRTRKNYFSNEMYYKLLLPNLNSYHKHGINSLLWFISNSLFQRDDKSNVICNKISLNVLDPEMKKNFM